jgi:ketosteroid isomerase-like protein
MPASLELVKIALQAYGNGDSEIVLALAAPLIRWDERPSRPDGDLVWGHDNVGRAMRRYLDGWEEYRFDVEDLAEVGPGKVVGICRERGKQKDGVAVDRRFGGLWIVEHGKIASWATYLTPREAVRAAKELLGADVKQPQAKPVRAPEPVERPQAKPVRAPELVEQPEAEPVEPPEPEPEVERPQPRPEAAEPEAEERPRKRALTKSEEQKRAARARAQMRKRASRQSA